MSAPQQGWHARLAELGVRLPPVSAPVAAYVPAVRSGSLVFTSGQLPFVDGGLRRTGKVGGSVDPEDAAADAKVCALNALAAVDAPGVEDRLGVVDQQRDGGVLPPPPGRFTHGQRR